MSRSTENADVELVEVLQRDFGEAVLCCQQTRTGMPVLWVLRTALTDILGYLKGLDAPYDLLYDLSAIDERLRGNRTGLPDSDFTVFINSCPSTAIGTSCSKSVWRKKT